MRMGTLMKHQRCHARIQQTQHPCSPHRSGSHTLRCRPGKGRGSRQRTRRPLANYVHMLINAHLIMSARLAASQEQLQGHSRAPLQQRFLAPRWASHRAKGSPLFYIPDVGREEISRLLPACSQTKALRRHLHRVTSLEREGDLSKEP